MLFHTFILEEVLKTLLLDELVQYADAPSRSDVIRAFIHARYEELAERIGKAAEVEAISFTPVAGGRVDKPPPAKELWSPPQAVGGLLFLPQRSLGSAEDDQFPEMVIALQHVTALFLLDNRTWIYTVDADGHARPIDEYKPIVLILQQYLKSIIPPAPRDVMSQT